jgi:hypothetical protein
MPNKWEFNLTYLGDVAYDVGTDCDADINGAGCGPAVGATTLIHNHYQHGEIKDYLVTFTYVDKEDFITNSTLRNLFADVENFLQQSVSAISVRRLSVKYTLEDTAFSTDSRVLINIYVKVKYESLAGTTTATATAELQGNSNYAITKKTIRDTIDNANTTALTYTIW